MALACAHVCARTVPSHASIYGRDTRPTPAHRSPSVSIRTPLWSRTRTRRPRPSIDSAHGNRTRKNRVLANPNSDRYKAPTDGISSPPPGTCSASSRAPPPLARQGRGRGLAEHWQGLKYCQATAAGPSGHIRPSPTKAKAPNSPTGPCRHGELGRAFGLRRRRTRHPEPLSGPHGLHAGRGSHTPGGLRALRPATVPGRPATTRLLHRSMAPRASRRASSW